METTASERCMDCGVENSIDIVLTREQWLKINPKDGGILCANCIVRRASALAHVINVQAYIAFASDFDGNSRKSNFFCLERGGSMEGVKPCH